jgi:hypothetical protein
MKTKKPDLLQKPSGLTAESVVPNVIIVIDAILEEQTAANKEQRPAQTSNVIAIFRGKSKDNLSDNDINYSTLVSKPTRKHLEPGSLKCQASNPLGIQTRKIHGNDPKFIAAFDSSAKLYRLGVDFFKGRGALAGSTAFLKSGRDS